MLVRGCVEGIRGSMKQDVTEAADSNGMQEAVICRLQMPLLSEVFNAT